MNNYRKSAAQREFMNEISEGRRGRGYNRELHRSNNAVAASEAGLVLKSEINKKKLQQLEIKTQLTIKEIKYCIAEGILKYAEWHHVGIFGDRRYFYNLYWLEDLNAEEINNIKQRCKAAAEQVKANKQRPEAIAAREEAKKAREAKKAKKAAKEEKLQQIKEKERAEKAAKDIKINDEWMKIHAQLTTEEKEIFKNTKAKKAREALRSVFRKKYRNTAAQ